MDNQGWGTREGPVVAAAGPDVKVTLTCLSLFQHLQVSPLQLLSAARTLATKKMVSAMGLQPPGQEAGAGDGKDPAKDGNKEKMDDLKKAQVAVEVEKDSGPSNPENPQKAIVKIDPVDDESKTFAERFVLDDGKQKPFDKDEEVFWRKMINSPNYLKPLNYSEAEKKKIATELYDLKNQYALGFVLVNAMWVAAVYMLQVAIFI